MIWEEDKNADIGVYIGCGKQYKKWDFIIDHPLRREIYDNYVKNFPAPFDKTSLKKYIAALGEPTVVRKLEFNKRINECIWVFDDAAFTLDKSQLSIYIFVPVNYSVQQTAEVIKKYSAKF